MSKNKQKKLTYAFGTTIENPATALYENQIAWAKANEKANNGWTKALDMVGGLAVKTGTSMMAKGMSQGQGVTAGADGIAAGQAGDTGDGFNWGSILQNLIGGAGAYATGASAGSFAFGGNTNVEVEGNEVAETPFGNILQFIGPSHEKGGIDVNLPDNTDIYSDRIKKDGITMAERKKNRKRKEMKLESLLGNSSDSATMNSLNRTKQVNEAENAQDMNVQKLVKSVMENPKQFAFGGNISPEPVIPEWLKLMMASMNKPNPNANSSMLDMWAVNPSSSNSAVLNLGVSDTGEIPDIGEVPVNQPTNPDAWNKVAESISGIRQDAPETEGKGFSMDNLLGNATLGDVVGLAGNMVSTFGPMKNTLANRAGDTPNINAFKDYGKDGLKKLDETKQFASQLRDEQLNRLSTVRGTASRRNRNTTRGINTTRALDIATDIGINEQEGNIYSSFAEQMMKILGQEAQMENQQDGVVMQGEQQRDLADRQDRDNFFSQMAKDIATKGQGLQETGYDLNKIKEREVIQNLLNELSKYGITVDSKGNLVNKK